MISEENIAQLRALIESVLDEKLAKYELRRRPPEDISEKRRAAAKAMLAKRAERALAEQMAEEAKAKRKAAKRANAEQKSEQFELPEWVPIRQWNEFLEMRKKIGKPLMGIGLNMAVSKLEELKAQGHHPARVLAQSVFNSWQGLFEVKDK